MNKNRNLPRGESCSRSRTQCNPVKFSRETKRKEDEKTWDGEKHQCEHPRRGSNISPPPNMTVEEKEGNKRNERWMAFSIAGEHEQSAILFPNHPHYVCYFIIQAARIRGVDPGGFFWRSPCCMAIHEPPRDLENDIIWTWHWRCHLAIADS